MNTCFKRFLLLATLVGPLSAIQGYAADVNKDSTLKTASYRDLDRKNILHDTKLVTAGGGTTPDLHSDSVQSLLSQFYEEQFRHFHDPDAPTFMFMSNDASLAMGVGGKMMLRGWFDWNGSQDGYEFFPYDIAVPKDPTQRHGLGASASQTALFFTLLGRRNGVRYSIYVQGGVKNKSFVLKKAYVKLNDFTLGLAGTTFEDGDAIVPTVDAAGPNGQVGKSQIVGRYFHTFRNGISLGAGVEFPSSSQNVVDNQTEACKDYIPDIAALVQYGWNGGNSHVRLSGLMRTMTYRNLLTSSNHNVVGWGAQVSGMINVAQPLTIYFTGLVGQGVGSYQGDLSEGDYDLVGEAGKPGKMVAPLCMGLTAGIQYNFTRKVFACIGLGETQYYQKHRLADDQYRYGLYGAANVFWKITPRFLAGVEYVVGKRMNFDGAHAGANRIDAMLSYSF